MKKFLSLVLALVMTMSLVTISAGAKDFTDDSTINYAEAVDVMSAIGVVGGYADGSFNPQGGLTRGAAAKIICNMILGPTTAGALKADAAPYKDVAVDNTFAGYIAFCAKEGIISGYADGTFRPAAPLTGYAFMKMLLGALGYDAAIEGYTGANWSINVAKRALNIGLDKGLDGEFVGSKSLTREEACLYGFNTLKADMVKYDTKGTQITINGVVIASGASDAESAEKTFAKTYFSKLKSSTTTDDFGRPATKWTWKSKEIGTYAKDADATYTAQVKTGDIYSDLSLSKSVKADVTVDGEKDDKPVTIAKKGDTKLVDNDVANGVLTEVYLVDEEEEKEDDETVGAHIIQINTYVGKVEDIDENDDDERYIVVDGLKYVTEEFEEDDIVLYTKTVDGKEDEIQSVALAEKQTGTVTKFSASKFTIDGESYSASAEIEATKLTAKEDVDFYLDNYGYIIKIDLTKDEITVDDLAYVETVVPAESKLDTNRARLVFVDGSKKTVVTDKAYDLEGTIVSFDVNDDDEYELSKVKQEKGSTVTKGTPKVAGVTANSKTVYTYILMDGEKIDSVETYTGYKNAPTATGKVVAYVKDNKAVAVFVIAASNAVESSSDKLTFIAVDAEAEVYNDEYYTFDAVVDGEVTSLDVKVAAVKGYNTGVYAFDTVKTNKDGMVTALTPVKDGTFKEIKNPEIELDDDLLILNGDAMNYTDDVMVLVVDDNEFDILDGVESIKTRKGTYETAQYTLDDGDIDVIVLTKATKD